MIVFRYPTYRKSNSKYSIRISGIANEAYSQPLFDRGVTEFRTDEVTIRDNEYDQNYYSEIEKWNDSNPIPGTREFAWSNYYSIIYYANAIIDNRDKITEGTQEDIDQLVGEAYLLRGYMHFLLVNLYGQPYTKDGAPETKAIPIKLDIDLEKLRPVILLVKYIQRF